MADQQQEQDSVRKTISLTKTVNDWAEQLMGKNGYDNFSAYVAELIRKDKEREEEKEARRLELLAKAPAPPSTEGKRKRAG